MERRRARRIEVRVGWKVRVFEIASMSGVGVVAQPNIKYPIIYHFISQHMTFKTSSIKHVQCNEMLSTKIRVGREGEREKRIEIEDECQWERS